MPRKPGRPRQENRSRVNLYIKPMVIKRIGEQVVTGDPRLNSMGKVVESKFPESKSDNP